MIFPHIIWALKLNCWTLWERALLIYCDALFLTEASSSVFFPNFFADVGPSLLVFYLGGGALPKLSMTLVT
jgi:hypothetical protein